MPYAKKIIFILIFILNAYLVSAEINLARTSYIPGETVQAELNFNYKPENEFTINDINIYSKEGAKISVGLFLIKLDNYHYYVYFNIPNIKPSNYTLRLDNYFYIKDNILYETSEQSILQIKEAADPIIGVNPGIIKLNIQERNYFSVNIKNNGNKIANISIKSSNGFVADEFFIINPGESKSVEVIDINSNRNENLKISYNNLSYMIPIWVISEIIEEKKLENITTIAPSDAIKFIESNNIINLTLSNNDSVEGGLRLKNFYDKPLYNLKFKLTNNLNEIIRLNLTNLDVINPGEIKKQYLWVNENKLLKKNYSGNLILSNELVTASFPIYINYKEITIAKTTTLIENVTKNITANQTFIEQPKKKSKVWIFVLVLIVIIILLLIFLFYKKKPKQQTFEEFLSTLKK